MKNFSQKIKNGGFTLVETLVAISILALAMTGPLVIAQKGLGSAVYSRDQITASYLAEDAIEYVRNVRDTNRINGYSGGWLSQFQTCLDPNKCQIDTTINPPSPGSSNDAISACTTSTSGQNIGQCTTPISFNSSENLYGYGIGDSWTPTLYTRTVDIKEINPGVEALVTVTISWQTNIYVPAQSFTVAEHIFAF